MSQRPRAAVIVLAAGEGSRVGADTNKILLPLGGLPVFAWSLRAIEALEYVATVVLVIREEDQDFVAGTLTRHFNAMEPSVVTGAATRHGSEWRGLQAIADDIDAHRIDVVAIHDAARPLAEPSLFEAVLDAAMRHGGALPSRTLTASVSRDPVNLAHPMPSRAGNVDTGLVAVQTPQAFRTRPLLDAYRHAERDGFLGTDTASCVEKYTDLEIRCVPSPATNIKITFADDVRLAERLLDRRRHEP